MDSVERERGEDGWRVGEGGGKKEKERGGCCRDEEIGWKLAKEMEGPERNRMI